MADIDWWAKPPTAPGMRMGQLIRERKVVYPPAVTQPTRLGGAEPKVIVAETRAYVIYRVWSKKGEDLGEHCLSKAEFDAKFERGDTVPYYE